MSEQGNPFANQGSRSKRKKPQKTTHTEASTGNAQKIKADSVPPEGTPAAQTMKAVVNTDSFIGTRNITGKVSDELFSKIAIFVAQQELSRKGYNKNIFVVEAILEHLKSHGVDLTKQ